MTRTFSPQIQSPYQPVKHNIFGSQFLLSFSLSFYLSIFHPSICYSVSISPWTHYWSPTVLICKFFSLHIKVFVDERFRYTSVLWSSSPPTELVEQLQDFLMPVNHNAFLQICIDTISQSKLCIIHTHPGVTSLVLEQVCWQGAAGIKNQLRKKSLTFCDWTKKEKGEKIIINSKAIKAVTVT